MVGLAALACGAAATLVLGQVSGPPAWLAAASFLLSGAAVAALVVVHRMLRGHVDVLERRVSAQMTLGGHVTVLTVLPQVLLLAWLFQLIVGLRP